MAEVRIDVPASLGLSQEQINRLSENFRNQLVAAMGGRQEQAQAQTQTQTLVRARPQVVVQSEEVGQVVEVR